MITGNAAQDVLLVLTLAGAAYFAWKDPEANWCAGLTVLVGQSEGGGSVWTSRILYAFLTLSVLRALGRRNVFATIQAGFRAMRDYASRSVLLLSLGLLLAKSIVDASIYGMDTDREAVLKAYVYLCATPAALIGLAFLTRTADAAFQVVLKGLWYFSLAIFSGYFIQGFDVRQIMSVITPQHFDDLLTYGGMDTINGGRFLFLTALSSLLISQWRPFAKYSKIALLLCGLATGMLLLNGTRQFLLSLAMTVFLLLTMTKRDKLRTLIAVAMLVAMVAFAFPWIQNTPLIKRSSAESVAVEGESGRGFIWRAAAEMAITNPLTGVGFRNFDLLHRPEIQYELRRSSAHGFLQDVAAEHGLILLGLSTLGTILAVASLMLARRRGMAPGQQYFLILAIALAVPELFSGAFANATGYHVLALAPIALAARRERQLAMQPAHPFRGSQRNASGIARMRPHVVVR